MDIDAFVLPLEISVRVVGVLAASAILNVILIFVFVSLIINENLGCITILVLALVSDTFLTFLSLSSRVFWVFLALYGNQSKK